MSVSGRACQGPGRTNLKVSRLGDRHGASLVAHGPRPHQKARSLNLRRSAATAIGRYLADGGSAQRPVEVAKVVHEQVGRFERGEMTAPAVLGPAHEVVQPVGDTADGRVGGEDRDRGGHP